MLLNGLAHLIQSIAASAAPTVGRFRDPMAVAALKFRYPEPLFIGLRDCSMEARFRLDMHAAFAPPVRVAFGVGLARMPARMAGRGQGAHPSDAHAPVVGATTRRTT